MPQIELFAIENPCVGIGTMNTKGCYIGCLSLLAHCQKRLIEHRTGSTADQAQQFELLSPPKLKPKPPPCSRTKRVSNKPVDTKHKIADFGL